MRGRVRGLFLGMKATPWSYLLPSQVGQAIFYIISLGKQMSICQNDEDFFVVYSSFNIFFNPVLSSRKTISFSRFTSFNPLQLNSSIYVTACTEDAFTELSQDTKFDDFSNFQVKEPLLNVTT